MEIKYTQIENIYCKYFYPKNEIKNIVIAIHGFAGDKESSVIEAVAKELENTTLVIAFDLPCHGEDNSNNVLNFAQCLNYLDTIICNTKSKYNNLPISIFATSFGAYLFLNYLKNCDTNFEHIILRSPAIFMDDVFVNSILRARNVSLNELLSHNINLGYNKELLVDFKFLQDLKNNTLSNSKFSKHIDIIQGDKDDVVSIKDNENFYKTNCSDYSLHYIKGADHRFKKAGELEQILSIVKSIIICWIFWLYVNLISLKIVH